MIKNHEEHQALISSCINDIHIEFDKILRVVVEDRSYSSKKDHSLNGQNVDLPHIRAIFESLLNVLSVLQIDANELIISGNKKKLNKSLAAFPCGVINVEEVASVSLRLLRVNSTSSPKHVRADKRSYDELIQVHLEDLHCLAWKIISFLFKNVEIGTEVFERELASLTRDLIKSDLKTIEKLGKGSERALKQFVELVKHSNSFNGQVFVNEIIRSGILLEISLKATQKFSSLLRSGGIEKETSLTTSNNKKVRYHQISESDQKRLENAQKSFSLELKESFTALSRNFTVFESVFGHLSPQEHVSLTENLLNSILVLFKSHHNFKFVPEIVEGEYLRILVDSLTFAIVSFQPAYIPPFLPISIRILNLIAGKFDASGLSARRALLQIELMIHPRRLGPVTYRPASDLITKLFERPEPQIIIEPVIETDEVSMNETIKEKPVSLVVKETPETTLVVEETPVIVAFEEVKEQLEVNYTSAFIEPVKINQDIEPVKSVTEEIPMPIIRSTKRSYEQNINEKEDDDEDDLPLPQIVDSGPDDN